MNVIIKYTLYCLLSLFALSIAVILLVLQSSPHIKSEHQIDAHFAAENKKTIQRMVKTIKSNNQPVLLRMTQNEIDGLSALSHRAIPQLTSDVVLTDGRGFFRFSIELPLPRFIRFLNINLTLFTSQTGLALDTVYIGSLPIPGNWLITLVELVSNTYIEKSLGSTLLTMVSEVDISPSYLQLNIQVPDYLNNNSQGKTATLIALRDQLALFGDVNNIRFYHQSLLNFIDSDVKEKSLAVYIAYMFSMTKQRSAIFGTSTAVAENKAALTALVLYFCTDKFELLIGDVSNYSSEQALQRLSLKRSVTLRGRVDIQKHFIYSVALQLFGNSSASDAIGELKEFLDANKGGSGFSFADLMADRAGTRLAMISTQTNESALLVQERLAKINNESAIIPLLAGLPEEITEEAFEQNYQNIKSPNYIAMLRHIDAQLLQIPLYQIQ